MSLPTAQRAKRHRVLGALLSRLQHDEANPARLLLPTFISPRAEQRARQVQAALVRRGRHRGVSIPDLLVGAVAEVEHLSVLHYDADFELIAEITGQSTEWVVPRGSID